MHRVCKMNIPRSAIEPFGPVGMLDKLIEAVLVEKLVQLAEEINRLPSHQRRRRYENMNPLLRAVLLTGLHMENE